MNKPVELVVLSVKDKSARCRLLGNDRDITVRATRLWTVVPGEIAVVQPRKQWSYAGHPYLSGKIESTRLDVAALKLVPLQLHPRGIWNPDEHYWGEPDEPIEEWAKPIITRGPRPEFEMEQILPGSDSADLDFDSIIESNDLKDTGDRDGACRILMKLCQADLRCLDAHAHLGNLAFDFSPRDAIRHYQVGVRIGELSLAADFDGLLPWGCIDNRPFLRCMSGLGLCLWRLNRFVDAKLLFDRMLWLNPSDNQGIRFLIEHVRAEEPWTDDRPAAVIRQAGGGAGSPEEAIGVEHDTDFVNDHERPCNSFSPLKNQCKTLLAPEEELAIMTSVSEVINPASEEISISPWHAQTLTDHGRPG